MAIKNVAVVGASGNVGAPTVTALLAAGFSVTAISRPSSTATFPAGVQVRKANLSSTEELTKALSGIDAVVSTITTPAILGGGQIPLIDAAIAAGVQRFLPSEFGTDSQRLPEGVDKSLRGMFGPKMELIEYLRKKESERFSWTGVATSFFFHWGLDFGTFGISLKDKTATIFDSGNTVVSTSNLDFIGRVVAAILSEKSLEATKNKYIDVWQFTTTQNELLTLIEEETGAKFEVKHAKTSDLKKSGEEKLAKGDYSAFIDLLLSNAYRDGATIAAPPENAAWTVLGMEKEELRGSVREYVKSRSG